MEATLVMRYCKAFTLSGPMRRAVLFNWIERRSQGKNRHMLSAMKRKLLFE